MLPERALLSYALLLSTPRIVRIASDDNGYFARLRVSFFQYI